ncbi:hypothetical protein OIU78_015882 [Salix suchowensis]|nr:hypothetical protein OIU78_015882 [Salix suchowensis]
MLISSNLVLPPWLQALLAEKFFDACFIHKGARKNERNIFCLDCCVSICPHCLPPHNSHRLLQIRRYVYNDVLRLDDAQKLFDCASVQSYTTNSAKVIFLNHRPQTRIVNIRGNNCSTCDRGLQYPYLFCSISCKVATVINMFKTSLSHNSASKVLAHFISQHFLTRVSFISHFCFLQVDHILTTKGVGGLSSFFCDCKFLPLPEPGSDDGLMTPDSVLEPAGSTKTSSSSGGYGGVDCRTLACTATTEIVRKKRSSLTSSCRTMYPRITEISSNLMSRRKKAPSRAPLY